MLETCDEVLHYVGNLSKVANTSFQHFHQCKFSSHVSNIMLDFCVANFLHARSLATNPMVRNQKSCLKMFFSFSRRLQPKAPPQKYLYRFDNTYIGVQMPRCYNCGGALEKKLVSEC